MLKYTLIVGFNTKKYWLKSSLDWQLMCDKICPFCLRLTRVSWQKGLMTTLSPSLLCCPTQLNSPIDWGSAKVLNECKGLSFTETIRSGFIELLSCYISATALSAVPLAGLETLQPVWTGAVITRLLVISIKLRNIQRKIIFSIVNI